MNMISTLPFLTETDANKSKAELVKTLTAAWEKKNSKAARAGGVSLMALSLAACGGSDDTPFSQADVDAAKAEGYSDGETAAEVAMIAAINDAIGSSFTTADDSATVIGGIVTSNDAAIAAAVDTTADDAAAILAAVQAVDATATTVAAVATNANAAGVASVDTSADDAAAISTALRDAAAGLGVTGTSTMTNAELITAIKTANDTDVANAVDLTTNDTAAINTAVAADTSFDTLAELVAAYNALANPSDFDAGVNNFTGTDADTTYNAGLTAAGGNTLNALDSLDGGAGSDTLNVSIATAVTPGAITNVETINVTFTGAVALNLTQMSGATALTNIGSSALGSVTNIGSTGAALTVADNAVGATFAYKATSVTGDSDAISLTLNNATGAATTTITGAIETINLVSTGGANSITLDAGATTLNVSGSEAVTLAAASTVLASATTIDASDATGAVTLASDAGAATAVTVTGGAGADALTLAGTNTATDTVSGGAGNDRIIFTTDLADADVISGGAGTDTLVGDDGQLAGLTTANNVTGIEVLEASTVLATTLTVANVDSSISSVTLAAGANAGTVAMGAGSQTLTLGTTNAGALTVNDTGLATDDTLTITAATGDNSMGGQALTVGGFETVNFSTGTNSLAASHETVSTVAVNGDPDSAGTNTSATLNLSGAANFTTTGAITVGDATTGTGTINAADMTGNFVMGAAAVGATTITGGAGSDTILGEDLASTLTGGAGVDAITGGSAADTIYGGAGNDTLNGSAAATAAAADTVYGEAGNDTFAYTDAELTAAVTLDGGAGTDILQMDDITAVADAQLANKSSIETVTSAATGMNVTLDTNAQAMGVTTITLAGTAGGGIADSVTLGANLTNDITVNIDAAVAADTNGVVGTNYTGTLTANVAVDTAINADAGVTTTLTGGTGTSDTLNIVGDTYTAAQLASVTAIENFVVSNDATASFTLSDNNAADGATLVIDGRAIVNTANTFTVVGTAEADGAVTVHGSTGVDTITGTQSDLGDTINTYAGADTINFAVNNLTTLDTVDGGAGSDTLTITSAGTLVDADFTNVTNIEALTFTAAATSATLGAEYSESGSSTITLLTGVANTLNMDAVTSNQTVAVIAGTDSIDASSMTGSLTVTIAEDSLTTADTLTAGSTGTDQLTVTFDDNNADALTATDLSGVSGFEKIVAASDAAASITLADANVASTASLTIDMSANATSATVVDISNETNGAITVIGGAATNTITMSASSSGDNITTGAGTDGITVAIAQLTSGDTLNGGTGTDTLTFSDAGVSADVDFTNVTNMENLTLAAGANTIVLGAEYSGAGFNTVTLGTGTDNVTLGAGVTTAQTVAQSSGTDTVDASASSAAITFTVAEDNFTAADTITGGSGTGDVLSITFDGNNADALTAAEMAGVTGIETIQTATNAVGHLILSDNNNVSSTLTINASNNTADAFILDASAENDGTITYVGGAGVDTVTGTTGADTIGGGAGADVITGGNGADTITGGAGADTFTYTAVAQSTGTAKDSITDYVSGSDVIAITINNSTSTVAQTYDATVQTAQAGTSNVQSNLSGSIGQAIYDTTNSVLVVNANADNLVTTLDYQIGVNAASTAANTIAAGDVNFTITAGSGNDTIVAGGGADTINGGAGADSITGGAGNDNLTGGTGADTFVFNSVATNGSDTIEDFAVGSDTLDLDTILDGITKVYEEIADDAANITTNANVIVSLDEGADAINTLAALVAADATVTGAGGILVIGDGTDLLIYHTDDLADNGTETLIATLSGIADASDLVTGDFTFA